MLVETALGEFFQPSFNEEVDVFGSRCTNCLQYSGVHVLEHTDGSATHSEHDHDVEIQPGYPFRWEAHASEMLTV